MRVEEATSTEKPTESARTKAPATAETAVPSTAGEDEPVPGAGRGAVGGASTTSRNPRTTTTPPATLAPEPAGGADGGEGGAQGGGAAGTDLAGRPWEERMHDGRIDAITRRLGAGLDRRGAAKTAAGAALGLLGLGAASEAALGKSCEQNKDCPLGKKCKNKKKQNNGKRKGRCK